MLCRFLHKKGGRVVDNIFGDIYRLIEINPASIEWEEIDNAFCTWFLYGVESPISFFPDGYLFILPRIRVNHLSVACLYVYSSASISELIEYTSWEQKFPKTFRSDSMRKWITDLESPRGLDAHCFLWDLYKIIEARSGEAKWNQVARCIKRFFNPADLAMGKVASSAYFYRLTIEPKCADISELCKELTPLLVASVALL